MPAEAVPAEFVSENAICADGLWTTPARMARYKPELWEASR